MAVITRPGAESRRCETAGVAEVLGRSFPRTAQRLERRSIQLRIVDASELQALQVLRPGPLAGGAGAFGTASRVNGTRGGGALTVLCAGAIVNSATGTIAADGGELTGVMLPGVGGGGGGSGGVIILASRTSVSNAGSISAKGSAGVRNGSSDGPGGGGGGGIVHLLAPAVTSAGTEDVTGGLPGNVSAAFTGTLRAGGGGGGACGGSGGRGGVAGVSAAGPGEPGASGHSLVSTVDPCAFF